MHDSWVRTMTFSLPPLVVGSALPKPSITDSLSPGLPSQPGLGRVWPYCWASVGLSLHFSRPMEGSRMDAPGLSRISSGLFSSCLQQLTGQWPGFCLLLSEQTFSFLPPGPFSEDIKLLAHCPCLLLPAALPGTTTSGQVAEPALSFSVLPA